MSSKDLQSEFTDAARKGKQARARKPLDVIADACRFLGAAIKREEALRERLQYLINFHVKLDSDDKFTFPDGDIWAHDDAIPGTLFVKEGSTETDGVITSPEQLFREQFGAVDLDDLTDTGRGRLFSIERAYDRGDTPKNGDLTWAFGVLDAAKARRDIEARKAVTAASLEAKFGTGRKGEPYAGLPGNAFKRTKVEPGQATVDALDKFTASTVAGRHPEKVIVEGNPTQDDWVRQTWDEAELEAAAKASEIPSLKIEPPLRTPFQPQKLTLDTERNLRQQAEGEKANAKLLDPLSQLRKKQLDDIKDIVSPRLSSATPLDKLRPFKASPIVLTPKSEIPMYSDRSRAFNAAQRDMNVERAGRYILGIDPAKGDDKSVAVLRNAETGEVILMGNADQSDLSDREKKVWADAMVDLIKPLSSEVSVKKVVVFTPAYEHEHVECYMQERNGHLLVFANKGTMSGAIAAYAPGEWERAELM